MKSADHLHKLPQKSRKQTKMQLESNLESTVNLLY
jgi:hypothetical protein